MEQIDLATFADSFPGRMQRQLHSGNASLKKCVDMISSSTIRVVVPAAVIIRSHTVLALGYEAVHALIMEQIDPGSSNKVWSFYVNGHCLSLVIVSQCLCIQVQ
jgi:hypothetical protein